MSGDRVCLAGYVKDSRRGLICVRPIFRNGSLDERWLYVHGDPVVRPFAVVELDFLQARPEPPHTEDWHVSPAYRQRIRLMDQDERWEMLAEIDDGPVDAVFGTPVYRDEGCYVLDGQGTRSLGTIQPATISEVYYGMRGISGKMDYRIGFVDQAGTAYRLRVTDLAFRYSLDDAIKKHGWTPAQLSARMTTFCQRAERVALRIGLARGWEQHPERCYLQITGVYTKPDFLSGRCHADFRRPPDVEPLNLADVPF